MEEHDWTPFSEDLVICKNCGTVCDEAASNEDWEAKCSPDPILVGDSEGGD